MVGLEDQRHEAGWRFEAIRVWAAPDRKTVVYRRLEIAGQSFHALEAHIAAGHDKAAAGRHPVAQHLQAIGT